MNEQLKFICDRLKLDYNEVVSQSRRREHVTARMMYVVMCESEDNTLRNVGKVINRDHTTVIYLRESYRSLVFLKDPYILSIIDKLNEAPDSEMWYENSILEVI
jgi:hypothetical protein